MSGEPAVAEILRAVAEVCRDLGVRWYLFGAQAVLVWGRPRLTGDVDVTLFLDPEEPDALVAALQRLGFEPRVANVGAFARRTRVVPLTHTASGFALDAVLGGPGLEEEFLRSARDVDLGGTIVPVIGPEELIVTKVLAGRAKDLEDVRGIIKSRRDELGVARVRALLRMLEEATDRADLLATFEQQLRAARRKKG